MSAAVLDFEVSEGVAAFQVPHPPKPPIIPGALSVSVKVFLAQFEFVPAQVVAFDVEGVAVEVTGLSAKR